MDDLTRQRAERQELLAALAPGTQHAVNNMVQVLGGTVDILRRLAKDEASTRRVDRLDEATRRLETMVRAFLTLARRPLPQAEAGDLALLVARLAPLIELFLPRGTKLETASQPEMRPVMADWSALDAAILVLLRQEAPRMAPQLRLLAAPVAGGATLRIEGLAADAATDGLDAALAQAGGRIASRGDALVLMLPEPGA